MQVRNFVAVLAVIFLAFPMTGRAAGGWHVVKSPNVPGAFFSILNGVAVAGLHDVWAVGNHYGGVPDGPLAEHWDGHTWSIVPTPNAPNRSSYFAAAYAVSSSDVWAVGVSYNGRNTTVVEHWNGTKWTIVPSPNLFPRGDNQLLSVAGSATNDVWAVGYATPDNAQHYQAFALHWNGSVWSIFPAPPSLILSAVVDPQGSVWVFSVLPSLQAGAFHLVGGSWREAAMPNPDSNQQLVRGASATSPSDIWVVAQEENVNQFPWTDHFDGAQWTLTLNPVPNQDLLYAISASGGRAWTVGNAICSGNCLGAPDVTEFWDGAKWTNEPTQGLTHWAMVLNGVATVPGTTYTWAVGTKRDSAGDSRTLIEFHP